MRLKAFSETPYGAGQCRKRALHDDARGSLSQSLIQTGDDSELPFRILKVSCCYSSKFWKVTSLLENVQGVEHRDTRSLNWSLLREETQVLWSFSTRHQCKDLTSLGATVSTSGDGILWVRENFIHRYWKSLDWLTHWLSNAATAEPLCDGCAAAKRGEELCHEGFTSHHLPRFCHMLKISQPMVTRISPYLKQKKKINTDVISRTKYLCFSRI